MSSFVLVIATGGTIACTADATGALVPTLNAEALVRACGTTEDVRVYDALHLDSSAMTLRDIDTLQSLVARALEDPHIAGIVITHGTDSMAETALALDLTHDDPRPVILTGAQYPADHPHPDGPENLRRAIEQAADKLRRGTGVLVHFGGQTLPARGLYKASTSAISAFALSSDMSLPRPRPVRYAPLAGLNIPILRAWPGADSSLIDALRKSGELSIDGVVIEALGSGNIAPGMAAGVQRFLEQKIPVVIATSVPNGEVSLDYGGAGGGATLGQLGAISGGFLRAGQARIALAVAIATGHDPAALIALA